MTSKFSTYICQNCGSETSQYFGKCLNCNAWNTIVEERKSQKSNKTLNIRNTKKSKLVNEIASENKISIDSLIGACCTCFNGPIC